MSIFPLLKICQTRPQDSITGHGPFRGSLEGGIILLIFGPLETFSEIQTTTPPMTHQLTYMLSCLFMHQTVKSYYFHKVFPPFHEHNLQFIEPFTTHGYLGA